MSGLVFVWDAQGTPLMPTSPAYARILVQQGKATFQPHHAFPLLQLTQVVPEPVLGPVVLGVAVHLHTAELFLIAEGKRGVVPLLRIIVDLRTNLPWRIRRRAMYRRRRRRRQRYRAPRRHGQPFKVRRPSLARSTWGSHLRRHHQRRRHTGVAQISPTIRWRAQAIERVITTLRTLVPIGHVAVLEPLRTPEIAYDSLTPAERRRLLIDAYGTQNMHGETIAQCAYCGSTDAPIEIDHLLPRSRGGTDAWNNLVLACTTCNAQKGDRTPAEAGLRLRLQPVPAPAPPQRVIPYRRRTARLVYAHLLSTDLPVSWRQSSEDRPSQLSATLFAALRAFAADPAPDITTVVAKPIARPRKQVFTARNYPKTTPLRPAFTQIGRTIKRRVQVNRGVALWQRGEHTVARVIGATEAIPADADRLVRIGMLCSGQRAGQVVVGIVSAIHSAGRVTLLTLRAAASTGIVWQRIVVSPRHLRVVSSDPVVFLPVSAAGEPDHA